MARAQGWPEAQLHCEFFAGAVTASDTDASFEVQLASSGQIVVVPLGKTVVQVSCERGVCCTCLTQVIEGMPDHKDLYLTPQEPAANDPFTPCCSRSKTPRLVLDL